MKVNLRIMIIIIVIITLVGCGEESKRTVDLKDDSAKTVVENYFEYKNEKNEEKLLTTLTERYNDPNGIWSIINI